jgi:hypothetical protein
MHGTFPSSLVAMLGFHLVVACLAADKTGTTKAVAIPAALQICQGLRMVAEQVPTGRPVWETERARAARQARAASGLWREIGPVPVPINV